MTTIVKSVLFVDFDSLHLQLHARDPLLARRFAARPGLLIEAIEAGVLIRSAEESGRRRILMRRLYADPRLIGRSRDQFVTQGYQIVDCPTLPGRERNSAEVQITLDTIDALGHATAFDEFILLGAETDFTPLIFRLRAHNRQATIYVPDAAAAAYRAIADGLIEEPVLVALFADLEGAADETPEEEAPRPAPQREELAQLARRIHAATNVPLFPPKVYGELFRALADEIAENGYHFLTTAENVAARLVAAGRRASRRQIAFVVKGLALKGHVFSGSDTPEQLAEVFREQVLFLARQAGIPIDARVERQVGAWIAGAWAEPGTAPAEPEAEAAPVPTSGPVAAADLPAVTEPQSVAATEAAAEPPPAPAPDAVAAASQTAEPIEADAPAASEAIETAIVGPGAPAEPAVEAFEPAEMEPVAVGAPAEVPAEPEPEPLEAEALAAIADEPASDTEPVATEPVRDSDVGAATARIAPRIRPPGPRNGAPKPSDDLDPFELSLLAAITQSIRPASAESGEAPSVPPVEPVKPEEKPAATADDDIDDEIQRILAAYTQNRKPGA